MTVSSTGGASLGNNGISIGGADASAFLQTNNCTTIAAGESCAVNVTYAPSDAGSQAATLTVDSTDPENASVDIPLSGTSVLEPTAEISVDPKEVKFGTIQVGTSADTAVTVSNLGDVALGVTSVTITGANSGDFMQSNDCTTLASDATCNVNVTYTASVAEASSATLVIESDDPDAGTVEVPLTGQGDDGSSGTLDLLLNLQGSTVINRSDSTLPLEGTIDTELNLATGMFTGDLNLQPTQSSFKISRFFRNLKATAKVMFESVDETTGTLIDGKLSATSTVVIKVPRVTINLFGFNFPIGGGSNCQTMDPVNITLQSPEGEQFSPSSGGQVEGVYNLPPLEHCGGLTDVLNLFLAEVGS